MNYLAQNDLSPDPLKILSNITCFKKILKGFKTKDLESFIEVITYQPKLIHSCLTKGFTPEDADFFKLSCKVYYNIPLISSAWFGDKKGFALLQPDKYSSELKDCNNEKQLLAYIASIGLPDKVFPVRLEMRQTIETVESTFTYKLNDY